MCARPIDIRKAEDQWPMQKLVLAAVTEYNSKVTLFNRPGVAGAVLHTAS